MFSFFIADFNLLYSAALLFVMFLALLEGVGLLIGLSLASALEDIFPIELDTDVTLSSGGLSSILGWLYLHRLPFLIWLILFLTSFGIIGLSINYVFTLPTLISFPITLFMTLFSCRFLGKKIAIIMPKNESSAISSYSFSGEVATITIGKGTKGNATEAVLHDKFKQKHYVLVEPEKEGQIFLPGEKVLLVEKGPNSWLAVAFESA